VSRDGVGEAGKAPLSSIFSAVSILCMTTMTIESSHTCSNLTIVSTSGQIASGSSRLQQAPAGSSRLQQVLRGSLEFLYATPGSHCKGLRAISIIQQLQVVVRKIYTI
jgi:hypothetical protein